MATNAEAGSSNLDTAKLAVAAILLSIGLVTFYYYAEESLLYRVLGLLAVVGICVGMVLTTAKGRNLWEFLQESRVEVRKMVWPNRTETVQTTLMVFVMVGILGVFLWLLDMLLGWLIRFVIG